MLDVGKKLSAALNVGDKLVAEKEKASKKKRQKGEILGKLISNFEEVNSMVFLSIVFRPIFNYDF